MNADDLGTNEQVNDETFKLIESGLVTSATIIANAPAFSDAARRVRDYPSCSFGVHLNLTVFPPAGSPRGLETVLEQNGWLSQRLSTTAISSELRRALRGELTAQIERVLDAGIPISHFDSHQHIHTIPQLFPVFKSVQKTFGIRRVRSTINLLPPGTQMSALRWLKKAAFRLALRHFYSTKSPDGLGDFRDYYSALKAQRQPSFRVLELMVHPGTSNPRYNEEVALLRSNWRETISPDVTLGSYHSL